MDKLAIYELEKEGYLCSRHFLGKDKFLFINEILDVKTDLTGLYLLDCTITAENRNGPKKLISRSILRNVTILTSMVEFQQCTVIDNITCTNEAQPCITESRFPSIDMIHRARSQLDTNSIQLPDGYSRIIGTYNGIPIIEGCNPSNLPRDMSSFIDLNIALDTKSTHIMYDSVKNKWIESNLRINIANQ